MTQVIPGEYEGIESALRRFKREVSKAGIFPDMRKHRHFETPIEKRKRKEIAKHKQRKRKFRYWLNADLKCDRLITLGAFNHER